MSKKRRNARKNEDDLSTKLLRAAVLMRWIGIVLFPVGGAISFMSLNGSDGETGGIARLFLEILLVTLLSIAALYLCSFLLTAAAKRLRQDTRSEEK